MLRVQVPQGATAAKILQEEERTERPVFRKKKTGEKKKPNKKEFCFKTTAIIQALLVILIQHTAITKDNVAVFFASLLGPRRSL